MKIPVNIVFIFALLMVQLSFEVHAQNLGSSSRTNSLKNIIGTRYQFKGKTTLKQSDLSGNTIGFGDVDIEAPDGASFVVKAVDQNNNYIIEFDCWSIPGGAENFVKKNPNPISPIIQKQSDATKILEAEDPSGLTNSQKIYRFNYYYEAGTVIKRHFLIPSAILHAYAQVVVSPWSPVGGAATLPFKWRPQHGGGFDKDLSISGLAGAKHAGLFGNDNLSYSILLGIGISSITTDSSNSKKPPSSDLSAITLSAGILAQYKTLQFGIFAGVDHLSNNKEIGWKYQGNPWFGVGIGFSIFSESQQGTTAKSDQSKNK